MLNVERLEYIIKEIQKEKAVYVSKLANKFFTSEATIRRDLSRLEKEGYLHRTHGGAVIADPSSHELPYAIRGNHSAKEVIGALAAQLVRNDMFVFMDASSTVMHMVKYMGAKNNLRIVTTSAQTALNCLDALDAHIYCTGGWIHSYSRGFIGEDARERIEGFNTDIAFFSARALSIEAGATDINEDEVILRQWMMKKSKKNALLCDSSKFNQTSFKTICPLNELDYLVTDQNPGDRWLESLQRKGVTVLYPKEKE